MREFAVLPAPAVQGFEEGGAPWIEVMVAKTYNGTPYGEVKFSNDRLHRMVMNFKNNVRGQQIPINFNHGWDRAKGDKAAGWFKDFAVRPSTADPSVMALFAQADLTEEAKKEIKDNQWKYFSLEWEDSWQNNEGATFEDVVVGGALTNKPIAKGMAPLPVNFSEKDERDFSAILYNEVLRDLFDLPPLTAESKEWEHSEPGTGSPPAPRTDEDGSDDPAYRGGWRRSTPPDQDAPPGPQNPSNYRGGWALVGEKGSEVIYTSTANSTSGIYKPTKGGNKVPEFVFAEKDARELFKVLDIDSDSPPEKVVETLRVKFGELSSLRKSVDAVTQEKAFAEQYPQYWEEHTKLMERDRENSAKNFAETVKDIRKAEGYGLKPTKQGLSTIAMDKVIEVHKKFSEGTATIADFEDCIKTIINGGILDFGEIGSSQNGDMDIPNIDVNSAAGVANARKVFAEVVAKVRNDNPEWDYNKCIEEAARKAPDLASAYKITLPA